MDNADLSNINLSAGKKAVPEVRMHNGDGLSCRLAVVIGAVVMWSQANTTGEMILGLFRRLDGLH